VNIFIPLLTVNLGLSIGLGFALNAKQKKLPYRTYVIMGDGEIAEGSVSSILFDPTMIFFL